ncbi:MAG TPA: acetylxylan esterase [Stackebrandtia sp.]|jgi:cephalosporin-C deacetylase|uniref:acetylxylan esterase n=1 Tax=Stackebrandtia sp. TaxID=2023065 RepID=UPI002D2EAF84|nr:acetylxylan esterase [Stackebrandtia sp.]HZE41455.1 acetylxylan esterase [Stackebrandtia sp.]
MPLSDLTLDELRRYRPERVEPADFDAFWKRSLAESAEVPLAPRFEPHECGLRLVDVYDTRFAGFGGDEIAAWLIVPKGATGVGCVVEYLGYSSGRGFPQDHLAWPAAGWALLVVDTRGQGANASHSPGITGDPYPAREPHAPGALTRGIASPDTYYYRRVITDSVRAVDVAAGHPAVDSSRVIVVGGSQGGALSQSVAALHPGVAAACVDVPFLSDFRRAAEIASTGPYPEIVRYLAAHRDQDERVFATLSYFDGVNFAARATVPALYSVALMDTTCPPSTVFAAYHQWGGRKDIEVYPWNGHEGGEGWQFAKQLAFVDRHLPQTRT